MFKSSQFIFSFVAAYWIVLPAYAHLGHLGDLAGHSHWIGLGAVVVAGVLATVVGKLSEQECDEDEELADEDDLAEGNAV